jgi:hypothetical protein
MRMVTDVEVLQETLHRYAAIGHEAVRIADDLPLIDGLQAASGSCFARGPGRSRRGSGRGVWATVGLLLAAT